MTAPDAANARAAIGVDVGGTTIKLGLVRDDGTLVARSTLPTEAEAGPDAVLARIASGVRAMLRSPECNALPAAAIGLGVPGVINDAGEISYPPNFPGWEVVAVADRLRPLIATELPIAVENDANVAAIAEARAGAGLNEPDFLYVTLGTGVGGCVIAGGAIWRGGTGGAGEVGHVSVDMNGRACNCGGRGCVEAYIGQRYMTAIAAERLAAAPDSMVHAMMADGAELEPRLLDRAADLGDPFARSFLDAMGEVLGAALASALNLLDYRLVVVGGGISGADRWLLGPARRSLRSRVLRSIGDAAELRVARFGSEAGMVGAALLAIAEVERPREA